MSSLVSIISPSYNCAPFIAGSIRSVLSQTYENWEMIIVDDCSTDDSEAIVRTFGDSRIRYFRNERNVGAAVSRNRALREAKGRWIAFLDCDDLWAPDKLERQVRFMEDNAYDFSYTCYSEMDANGNDTGVTVCGPKKISRAGMFAFCWPGCLTVMYDAQKVGLVQIADIKKNNDYAMWLKVCRKADCHLLPQTLARYRRGRVGSVSTHGVSTMIKWHYRLFREAEHFGPLSSAWHTCVNLACGFYKKLRYVRRSA